MTASFEHQRQGHRLAPRCFANCQPQQSFSISRRGGGGRLDGAGHARRVGEHAGARDRAGARDVERERERGPRAAGRRAARAARRADRRRARRASRRAAGRCTNGRGCTNQPWITSRPSRGSRVPRHLAHAVRDARIEHGEPVELRLDRAHEVGLLDRRARCGSRPRSRAPRRAHQRLAAAKRAAAPVVSENTNAHGPCGRSPWSSWRQPST